jgi:hypothetical protein
MRKEWTANELKELNQDMGKMPAKLVAAKWGVSEGSIFKTANRIGTSQKERKQEHGRDMLAKLVEAGYTMREIRYVLGESVYRYC